MGALPGPCVRVGVLCPQCVSWADRPRGKEQTLPRGEALSCRGVLHRDPQLCSAGPRAEGPPLPTALTARNAERHCEAEIVRRKSLQLPAQYILKQDNPSRGTLESVMGGEPGRCSRQAGSRAPATRGSGSGAHLAPVVSRAWAGEQPWGGCRHPTGCPSPLISTSRTSKLGQRLPSGWSACPCTHPGLLHERAMPGEAGCPVQASPVR